MRFLVVLVALARATSAAELAPLYVHSEAAWRLLKSHVTDVGETLRIVPISETAPESITAHHTDRIHRRHGRAPGQNAVDLIQTVYVNVDAKISDFWALDAHHPPHYYVPNEAARRNLALASEDETLPNNFFVFGEHGAALQSDVVVHFYIGLAPFDALRAVLRSKFRSEARLFPGVPFILFDVQEAVRAPKAGAPKMGNSKTGAHSDPHVAHWRTSGLNPQNNHVVVMCSSLGRKNHATHGALCKQTFSVENADAALEACRESIQLCAAAG